MVGGVVPTGVTVGTTLPAALILGVEEKLIDRVDVADGEAVTVNRAVDVAEDVEGGVFVERPELVPSAAETEGCKDSFDESVYAMDILGDNDNEKMDEEVRVNKGETELLLLLVNTAVPETLPLLVPVKVSKTVPVGVSVLVPEEASEGVSTQEKGERNEVLDTEADDV